MKKELFEQLINNLLKTGADYSEIYYEESIQKSYWFIDSKLDNINTNTKNGIGLRIIKDKQYYYTSTNNLEEENLLKMSNELATNLNGSNQYNYINLTEERKNNPTIKIKHNEKNTEEKIEYLKKIDQIARNYSPLIKQVGVMLQEDDTHKQIANSNGVITDSYETRTRLYLRVYASNETKNTSKFNRIDYAKGYEMLDDIDIEQLIKNTCDDAIESLNAIDFKGGQYPVIIGSGFGALIFHEACGHALEATSVAPRASILSNKLGEKIASNKVTLIDDGSINAYWGSTIIDDEGEYARKNILIENGILKGYMVDRFHTSHLSHDSTGSSRRASYLFAPTSRMTNTYLAPGNDKIEDMFQSIEYGIYVKEINYGSVRSETGDFNFFTSSAYLIENGKIGNKINNVSLIGNCLDILNNVEMVSNDLKFEGGYCSSKSGIIYITAGQPTIKVSNILIGGKND